MRVRTQLHTSQLCKGNHCATTKISKANKKTNYLEKKRQREKALLYIKNNGHRAHKSEGTEEMSILLRACYSMSASAVRGVSVCVRKTFVCARVFVPCVGVC